MLKFSEYLLRREVSYNPLHGLDAGDVGDAAKTIAYPFVAGPAAVYGAGAGLGATAGVYRAAVTGNPYVSHGDEATSHLSRSAFERSRDWVLDYIAEQPKNRKELLRKQVLALIDKLDGYFAQNPGIQKPGVLGRAFALPRALVGGLVQALVNAFDTLNPNYDSGKEWGLHVQNLISALEAMGSLQNGKDLVDRYLDEFHKDLISGARSHQVDADARYVPKKLPFNV